MLNQPVLFWDSWKISFKCVCRYCFWCVPGSNAKKIIRSQIITNFAHFPLRFTEQTTFWHFLSCKFDSSKLLVSTGIYQQQLLGLKSRNGGQYRLRYDHVNPLLSSWKHQKSCKCFFLWFSVVVLILAVDPSLSILYLKSISTFFFFFFSWGNTSQVGMQNSSLGVVLAASHFTSPMVALPPAMSAVIMNIMGSSLGFFWRYTDPSDSKDSTQPQDWWKLKMKPSMIIHWTF